MMSDRRRRRGAVMPYDEGSGVGERVAVGPAVIVVPPLELDLASAGELEQDISNAYLAGAGKVTVDFASVLFCDSSGLRVLVNAAKLARRQGVLFEVCNPTQQLLQMTSIVGASDALDLPPPPG